MIPEALRQLEAFLRKLSTTKLGLQDLVLQAKDFNNTVPTTLVRHRLSLYGEQIEYLDLEHDRYVHFCWKTWNEGITEMVEAARGHRHYRDVLRTIASEIDAQVYHVDCDQARHVENIFSTLKEKDEEIENALRRAQEQHQETLNKLSLAIHEQGVAWEVARREVQAVLAEVEGIVAAAESED
jgi:DNA-directed RNA polymerase beta subunit